MTETPAAEHPLPQIADRQTWQVLSDEQDDDDGVIHRDDLVWA